MRTTTGSRSGSLPASARSAIIVLPASGQLVGALGVSATSSTEARVWEEPFVRAADGTTSGVGVLDTSAPEAAAPELSKAEPEPGAFAEADHEASQRAVSELRRLSGLTWEQLAELFGVSRRSLHFWASGKPLSANHERRLLAVLDVVRFADRGNARANRMALVEPHEGATAFSHLLAGDFDAARTLLGKGAARRATPRVALSPEASAERAPLPPDLLVEALHDPVHRESGRARGARAVRRHGREPR